MHRRYQASGQPHQGVALKTTDGKVIYNWPEQDYDNGVSKNDRTAKRYKALVRILKNMRSEMERDGIIAAKGIASYLIACLAWNVPDHICTDQTYLGMVEKALTHLIEQTADFGKVKEWGEVNELKYLFRDAQPWKLADVQTFLKSAFVYLQGLTT